MKQLPRRAFAVIPVGTFSCLHFFDLEKVDNPVNCGFSVFTFHRGKGFLILVDSRQIRKASQLGVWVRKCGVTFLDPYHPGTG